MKNNPRSSSFSLLVMMVTLLLLSSCFGFISVVNGDSIRDLLISPMRKGVTSASMSDNSCIKVRVGRRVLDLFPSLEANELVLFEPNNRIHSEESPSFDLHNSRDILTLGVLDIGIKVNFDDTLEDDYECQGIFPLGPSSGLWGLFSCFTFSGRQIYLGQGPSPQAFQLGDTIRISGIEGTGIHDCEYSVDLNMRQILAPVMTHLTAGFRIFFDDDKTNLFVPSWAYYASAHYNPEQKVIFGMSATQIAALTVCQDRGVINNDDSCFSIANEGNIHFFQCPISTEGRTVFITPLQCHADGWVISSISKIAGFFVMAFNIAWFLTRLEGYLVDTMGMTRARTSSGGVGFFISPYLAPLEESLPAIRQRTGHASSEDESSEQGSPEERSQQVPWLFMVCLTLWACGTILFNKNQLACLLCATAWTCPLNFWLPETLQEFAQIYLVLSFNLLTAICIFQLFFSPATSKGYIPVPQLGFAVAWCLSIPLMGNIVDTIIWLGATVMWNWCAIADALRYVKEVIPQKPKPKNPLVQSGGFSTPKSQRYAKIFDEKEKGLDPKISVSTWVHLALYCANALLLSVCSIVCVFDVIFIFFGPGMSVLYPLWTSAVYIYIVVLPPLTAHALEVSLSQ